METHKVLSGMLTVLVVAIMVGASELSGEREIIFPEITAISVGMLLAPRRSWQTDRARVLLLISMSAMLGLAVSVMVPLPLWVKMSLAFVLSQFVLSISGTGFAPLISAAVLPVMLGTESPVYLAAAVLLTALILLVSLLLERLGVREKEPFQPVPLPEGKTLLRVLLKCVLGVLCIAAAVGLRARYAVAPPMLVAFTEFMNPENKAKKTPLKTVALISLCALVGAVCRQVLTVRFALPLTVSAVVATVLMLLILRDFQMYLPPAGALTILAMLIPADAVLIYPLEVFLGVSVLMGLAKLTDAAELARAQIVSRLRHP